MLKRCWAVSLVAVAAMGLPARAQDKPAKPESIVDRKVDDLVKDLVSGDEVRREIAETELPRRGKAAIAPVLNCLQAADQSTVARVGAAKILRKLLVPKGSEAVDSTAVSGILAVYKDAKAPLEVRGEAALALGDLKVKEAVPDLIEGLNDNWFKVSENSRQGLVRIGQAVADQVAQAYTKEVAAKDGRDGIIYRSLLILGEVGGDKARACLAEAMKTKAGSRALAIRAHAARALGTTGEVQAIQPLIDAYEVERDFDVNQAIVRALEWLTNQRDIPPQPLRWKAWWEAHKDELLGSDAHKYDGLLLPKNGLKKGDPLEAPAAGKGDAPAQNPPPK
jgi:HEAT repeat protein